MTQAWPYPADRPVDRARRIANWLLAMLTPADQAKATAQVHAFGETWLGSTLVVYTDDQDITTSEAAALLVVSEDTIRQWACIKNPERPELPLLPRFGKRGRERTYLVEHLREASAVMRRVKERLAAQKS